MAEKIGHAKDRRNARRADRKVKESGGLEDLRYARDEMRRVMAEQNVQGERKMTRRVRANFAE